MNTHTTLHTSPTDLDEATITVLSPHDMPFLAIRFGQEVTIISTPVPLHEFALAMRRLSERLYAVGIDHEVEQDAKKLSAGLTLVEDFLKDEYDGSRDYQERVASDHLARESDGAT